MCDWHGQVIGIKNVNLNILETSSNFQPYKAVLFNQILHRQMNLTYAFGAYVSNNYRFVDLCVEFDYVLNSTTKKQ